MLTQSPAWRIHVGKKTSKSGATVDPLCLPFRIPTHCAKLGVPTRAADTVSWDIVQRDQLTAAMAHGEASRRVCCTG